MTYGVGYVVRLVLALTTAGVGSRFRSRPGSAFAPISPSKHQILLRPTNEQGVRPFRETTRLSDGDKAKLMGGSLEKIYSW